MNTDTAQEEREWIERERSKAEREEQEEGQEKAPAGASGKGEKQAEVVFPPQPPVHDFKLESAWGKRREAEIRAKLAEFEYLPEIEELQKELRRARFIQRGAYGLAVCPVCDNAKPEKGFRRYAPGKPPVCAVCAHGVLQAMNIARKKGFS